MSEGSAVKVAVRVRPLNSREIKMDAKVIVKMEGKQTVLQNPSMEADLKKFTFDFSYNSMVDPSDRSYTTQSHVYRDLGVDVVNSCFEGYNACVFAYGQTGSGKSYSMMGYGEKGLIPRICEGIFKRADTVRKQDPDTTFAAHVGYLEIYNEKVRDLLGDTPKGQVNHSLRVREDPKLGPFVDGLTSHTVTDYEGIDILMEKGNGNRTTAATNMNDTSSRSHAVFTMRFTQAMLVEGVPCEKTSKINLVDLAGSERTSSTGATGLRLKEGGNINKSLTTLGQVIHALAERSNSKKKKLAHVPYRDSVLTWLLRESLGGNSKTIMVAAISPADVNYGETLSTLHYANRAKNIVNKAIINEDENVRIIKELRSEVMRLKQLLGGDEAIAALEAKRKEAQQRLEDATTDEERVAAQQEIDAAESDLQKAETTNTVQAGALKQAEQMMSAMTDKWKQKWKDQTDILEQRALEVKESGRALQVNSEQPHLVSLNLDDPLATGITLYYLHEGSTTLGREGTVDAMGTEPDIALVGDDVLPEHCNIENSENKVVTLEPLNGGKCTVNGRVVHEITELTQGMTISFGLDNIFRFNHPFNAIELRKKREEERESRANSLAPSGAATPMGKGGSGTFSPGQVFETQRTAEREKLKEAQQRLEELQLAQKKREEEEAAHASERQRKEQESLELQAKLAELSAVLASKDKSMEDLARKSEEEKKRGDLAETLTKEREEIEAARMAALEQLEQMKLEKEQAERERKAREDEEKIQMEAEKIREQQTIARLAELESVRMKIEQDHSKLEQEHRALTEEMEAKMLEAEMRIAAQELQAERERETKEGMAAENARLQQEREAVEAEKARQALEAARLAQEAEAARLKAKQTEESLKAMEALHEAKKVEQEQIEHQRVEEESKRRKQIATLEKKLKRAETMTVKHKDDAQSFEDMWSIRIPRFHVREPAGGGKPYVVYEVRLSLRGEEWKVLRRYSQFDTFNKEMKKRHVSGSLFGLKFPGKGPLLKNTTRDTEFLKERRMALERWLHDLILRAHTMSGSPFHRCSKIKLQRELSFFNNASGMV